MSSSDGMNYAPKGKPNPVVKDGESFAIAVFAHGVGLAFGGVVHSVRRAHGDPFCEGVWA